MKSICFALAFFASSLFGALPPLAQSSKEIQAILADPRLQEQLGSAEVIHEIIRTNGGYVVMTQSYSMRVDVHYSNEPRRIGPVSFHLEFYPPVDLKTGEPVTSFED